MCDTTTDDAADDALGGLQRAGAGVGTFARAGHAAIDATLRGGIDHPSTEARNLTDCRRKHACSSSLRHRRHCRDCAGQLAGTMDIRVCLLRSFVGRPELVPRLIVFGGRFATDRVHADTGGSSQGSCWDRSNELRDVHVSAGYLRRSGMSADKLVGKVE